MKVIIAGSRSITSRETTEAAIADSGFEITEVVCGGAIGVDAVGLEWGRDRGIPVRVYPALWSRHGRSAGPIRNGEMAWYADALIAVWDGYSLGTKDMIEKMQNLGKPLYVGYRGPNANQS